MNRRDFLKASGLSALAAGLLPRAVMGQDGGKKPARIALQLYSLREDSKKDFDAVLAEVGKLGTSARAVFAATISSARLISTRRLAAST
jgi:hypothetical protein